ncbi:MAG: ABC transporter ATP-binding protein [Methanospirillaceae archaeon]|nr:ABC transporter ATP-binding protein [Methanospirillaceae archaeon]
MTAIIITSGLTKQYGDLVAVNDLNLTIRKGSFYGLLGPNGSGKTTIIKMLTGQIRPTSGSATVLSRDVTKDPIGVRSCIGIIPEQETPPSFLTAKEYFYFVGDIRSIHDIAKRADWWFSFLEFSDTQDVLCKDLSRGTRQKLMFAQAFIHQPSLAIIDEPLVNFDPIMQRRVKDYLLSYREAGNTIFMSTHLLGVAEEICSEFAIMHKGEILYSGETKELQERNQHLDALFLDRVRESGDE